MRRPARNASSRSRRSRRLAPRRQRRARHWWTPSHGATATGAALDRAEEERDAAQAAADAARQAAVEITERLRATRAELAAAEEPHDAEARLGRRLAAAGWSSLLDTIDAPEAAWPAVEAVVGGELEGALLWTGDDPRGQLADARGAARLLAGTSANGDDGRRRRSRRSRASEPWPSGPGRATAHRSRSSGPRSPVTSARCSRAGSACRPAGAP